MRAPIELTARAKKVGGGLVEIVSYFGTPFGYSRLTIWIHGFNNTEYAMRDLWQKTHVKVRGEPELNLKGTVWLFWPGEAFQNRLVSAPLYFMEVRNAVAAGNLLADYLISIAPRNRGLRVNLVAHSLGSRVALQTALRLKELEGPIVDSLILFAAAVPDGLCLNDKPYSPPLARKEIVFHSSNDKVLRFAFPLGQRLARRLQGELDPSPLRKAVGYTGGPPGRWSEKSDSCGLNHGDYWIDNDCVSTLRGLYFTPRAERRDRARHSVQRGAPLRLCTHRRLGHRFPRD